MGVELGESDGPEQWQHAALVARGESPRLFEDLGNPLGPTVQELVDFLMQFPLCHGEAAANRQPDADDDQREDEEPDACPQAHRSRTT